MPRNRVLRRALKMTLTLERCRVGMTLDELAAEHEVTSRTIRRDLEALQDAGVPLIDDKDGQGVRRWRALNWRSEVA